VFHVGHLDGASDLEAAVLVVLLVASVVVPAGLLAVALRLPDVRAGADAAGPLGSPRPPGRR
jgi:hypothetical protein